jgi:sugar phosphate isomerase/epimerase
LPDMLRKRGLANGGTFSPCSEYVLSWASASKTPLMWVAAKAKGDRAAISMLKSYAKKSLKSGVLSALHNELRSSFQTQDQIERALNTIPELALCYDTAHADGAGMNVNEVFEKYKTRLALVHLKDLREKLPKSLIRFRRDFVNVGKGVVDLRSIVSELYSIKYKGQLMLEIEALEGQDPESAVREGYDYIQKIL